MTRDEAIKYAKENILAYTSEMAGFKVLAIEALEKMKELEKGLEDLEDTLNDAYTLNDFCLNKVILNQITNQNKVSSTQ